MRFYDLVVERGHLSGAETEAIVFDASEIAGELDKLESIEEGTPHPVTGVDGLMAMKIDRAIDLSHQQRAWVSPG